MTSSFLKGSLDLLQYNISVFLYFQGVEKRCSENEWFKSEQVAKLELFWEDMEAAARIQYFPKVFWLLFINTKYLQNVEFNKVKTL